MDPNTLWKWIKDEISANQVSPLSDEDRAELVEFLQNLASWIEKGGAIPQP